MPARTTYRNGDEITLACGCNGCSPAVINGLLCHETGCPEAWRDREVDCFECGCPFLPAERGQRTCPDCLDPPALEPDTCDACGSALEVYCDGFERCLECQPCPACDDGGMDAEDEDEV